MSHPTGDPETSTIDPQQPDESAGALGVSDVPSDGEKAQKFPPGMSPAAQKVLREHAIKKGEKKNPKGTNQWKKAQERFRKFAMALDPDDPEGRTRDHIVLQATFDSARKLGPAGAADRKLWHENIRGKPRQQVDVTSDDKPVSGVMLVPVAGDMASWEEASVEAQRKLQEDVRK